MLQTMAPLRAIDYIKLFQLPAEEELYLIETDVRRKSYVQVSQDFHTTPEVIKRRKRAAYAHIADAIKNEKAP